MRVFISWSRDRSKMLALKLQELLPVFFQGVEVFVSPFIPAGKRWSNVLAEELEGADFGIACLVQETKEEKWILFEQGAIAVAGAMNANGPLACYGS